MNVDQVQRRDARIAALEAMPRRDRTIDQQDELARLLQNRDLQWRRLPAALATAQRRARELETYARQIGLPLERMPA